MRRILICLFACTAAAAQGADVYKWTDANGVVHYADHEPPGDAADAQLLRVTGRITPETVAQRDARIAAEAADETGETGAKAPENEGPGTESTEVRCQRARSELELLQSGQPVAQAGGGGALDDAARKREIARAQFTIARDCK